MKYMFIGDLHGRTEIVSAALADRWKDYTKVFVGDYLDSYDRSVDDQVTSMTMVMDAIERRDDVIGLLGNHELSYLSSDMRCSGYKAATQAHVNQLKDRMGELLRTHLWIGKHVLVTHAGATGHKWDSKKKIRKALKRGDRNLWDIGVSRGGWNNYGGIFWCDFWDEYVPISGLTQVTGHSNYRPEGQLRGIVYKPGCYNIDCLSRTSEVLLYDKEEEQWNTANLRDWG